jgi:hypothetical protein
MVNVLWISAIGMGLVFLAILLLWGLMALLVRLTAEKPSGLANALNTTADEPPVDAALLAPGENGARARRQRAAAAGVAAALALRAQAPTTGSQPAANLSTWQAVQRAGQLGQRNGAQRKRKS